MKLKFFESLAGSAFAFRPDRTYDVVPGQRPHCLSKNDIVRLVGKGIAQPDGPEAEKEFNALSNTGEGKRILETASLR